MTRLRGGPSRFHQIPLCRTPSHGPRLLRLRVESSHGLRKRKMKQDLVHTELVSAAEVKERCVPESRAEQAEDRRQRWALFMEELPIWVWHPQTMASIRA